MAILKSSTVSGDLIVSGKVYADDGVTVLDHAVALVSDTITGRTNKVVKFGGESEHLVLSTISDTGTTVTIGTASSHILEVKGILRLFDTSNYITLSPGTRTSTGTFTFPNVSSGTVATINNAATWSAVQTHNANIVLGGSASLEGNAATASKLKNAVQLNSVSFDGSSSITVKTNVANQTSGTGMYLLMAGGSGNVDAKIHNGTSQLRYDPSTGTLHATIFSGNLQGAGSVAENASNLSISTAFAVPYQSNTNQVSNPSFKTTTFVSPNITTTPKFLKMTGTGSAGTAPVWDTLGTIKDGKWEADTIAVAYGGTGVKTLTSNKLLRGNGTGSVLASSITDDGTTVSTNSILSLSYASTSVATNFSATQSGNKSSGLISFSFSNSSTTETSGISKTSLQVLSEGTWKGSQNIAIFSRASGCTGANYSFYGAGGDFYNSGDVNVGSGAVYRINGTNVLSSNTLGTGITKSYLKEVGTITSGTWSATTIATTKGGTGLTTYAKGDIIYSNNTDSLTTLSKTTTGNVLLSGDTPSWGKVGLGSHVSGTLSVESGGTGLNTLTANRIYKGNGTGALAESVLSSDANGVVVDSGKNLTLNSGSGRIIQNYNSDNSASGFSQVSTGTKTGVFKGVNINNNAESITADISKIALYASTSGSWAGYSIAIYAKAEGGNTNYSFYGNGGDFYNKGNVDLGADSVYRIGGSNVLTSTKLGDGVTSSKLTSVGTIGAGTWQGTKIAVGYGGTGLDTYAKGAIIYADNTNSLAALNIAAAGNVLISGTTPSWGKVNLGSHITGILAVGYGGTGTNSFTSNKVLKGSGTNAIATSNITDTGTAITMGTNTSVTGNLDASGNIRAANTFEFGANAYIQYNSTAKSLQFGFV